MTALLKNGREREGNKTSKSPDRGLIKTFNRYEQIQKDQLDLDEGEKIGGIGVGEKKPPGYETLKGDLDCVGLVYDTKILKEQVGYLLKRDHEYSEYCKKHQSFDMGQIELDNIPDGENKKQNNHKSMHIPKRNMIRPFNIDVTPYEEEKSQTPLRSEESPNMRQNSIKKSNLLAIGPSGKALSHKPSVRSSIIKKRNRADSYRIEHLY